ncbi:hypothetical protein FRUB_04028 [Fimbriiglobus ruber]|uniref:Uncharacterized protein n=1 Tax=Fimbriiglobus ruber TaxID=1908690 RepID=A0A225DKE8_9BACT|nr:hypothetical protein FRUB_04028 [Fimbriiglobus ruber]
MGTPAPPSHARIPRAVESGCKTVVGSRHKGTGMRWREHGSHAVCHVRALYRNEKGQWDAF